MGRRALTVVFGRTSRLVDQSAKPALPRFGATLPEAAKGLSRIQHDHGTTRRANSNVPPANMYFNES
jgi:hypothetical protein